MDVGLIMFAPSGAHAAASLGGFHEVVVNPAGNVLQVSRVRSNTEHELESIVRRTEDFPVVELEKSNHEGPPGSLVGVRHRKGGDDGVNQGRSFERERRIGLFPIDGGLGSRETAVQ